MQVFRKGSEHTGFKISSDKNTYKSRYRYKGNIEMDVREFVCEEIDTIYLRK